MPKTKKRPQTKKNWQAIAATLPKQEPQNPDKFWRNAVTRRDELLVVGHEAKRAAQSMTADVVVKEVERMRNINRTPETMMPGTTEAEARELAEKAFAVYSGRSYGKTKRMQEELEKRGLTGQNVTITETGQVLQNGSAPCPKCGRVQELTSKGYISTHHLYDSATLERYKCTGSGRKMV